MLTLWVFLYCSVLFLRQDLSLDPELHDWLNDLITGLIYPRLTQYIQRRTAVPGFYVGGGTLKPGPVIVQSGSSPLS